MKYAVVLNGIVMCVADWDGVSEWEVPFGGVAISLADQIRCEAGWHHDVASGSFVETGE